MKKYVQAKSFGVINNGISTLKKQGLVLELFNFQNIVGGDGALTELYTHCM
jgi:hypothetical protein